MIILARTERNDRIQCHVFYEQAVFDLYYRMRSLALDKIHYRVERGHITPEQYTRRAKRINQWFDYKVDFRLQELVIERLTMGY